MTEIERHLRNLRAMLRRRDNGELTGRNERSSERGIDSHVSALKNARDDMTDRQHDRFLYLERWAVMGKQYADDHARAVEHAAQHAATITDARQTAAPTIEDLRDLRALMADAPGTVLCSIATLAVDGRPGLKVRCGSLQVSSWALNALKSAGYEVTRANESTNLRAIYYVEPIRETPVNDHQGSVVAISIPATRYSDLISELECVAPCELVTVLSMIRQLGLVDLPAARMLLSYLDSELYGYGMLSREHMATSGTHDRASITRIRRQAMILRADLRREIPAR